MGNVSLFQVANEVADPKTDETELLEMKLEHMQQEARGHIGWS